MMATLIKQEVEYRDMRREDLAAGYALSSEQKWPHRPEDWEFLFQNGRGLVAVYQGQVVGTIMSWDFGDHASTLGMVIVSNHCQGMGIGRQLMRAMLDMLGDRSVMLNATTEGIRLYESEGFVATGMVFQHQSSTFSVPMPELLPAQRVRPMGVRDRELLTQMFSAATGMDRAALFRELQRVGRGVVLTRDNEPVGFSLVRRFGRGYSIGPTIAPDSYAAKELIAHWLGRKVGKFCRLDVTEASGLSPWLEELGLPCVGQVTNMVRGKPITPYGDARIFSLVSQAM